MLVWGEVTSLMQWLELLWGFVELTGASTGRFVLPHRWRRVCVGHLWVITRCGVLGKGPVARERAGFGLVANGSIVNGAAACKRVDGQVTCFWG